MIKVCHMTSVHKADDGRIFQKQCSSLAKAGYEVSLVAGGESYEENGVHIVGVGELDGGRIKRMLKLSRRVYKKALEQDADIYQIHDPELLLYALKLKRRGKTVIFDSHEKYTDLMKDKPYLPGWSTGIVAGLYGAYERSVLGKIDAVIFPCLKNGKHPFAGHCRRAVTVDNFPILEELYDRYDSSIPKKPRSICHIGSLTRSRGITNVVKAAYASDTRAYLAGSFSPEEYRSSLESMPEFANTSYLGELDRDGVCRLLQECQIGMATLLNIGQYNQYDNLATKVYEYMLSLIHI